MNRLVKVFLIFNIIGTFAASPSVEGLFRHPSNGDAANDTVLLSFSMTKEISDAPSEELRSDDQKSLEKSLNTYFVKYIFDKSNKQKVRLLKVFYSSKDMSTESIVNIKYYDSLSSTSFRQDQAFFNAVISSLVLNRSEEMMNYLKSVSKDVKVNKEVLDSEKISLLNRYKTYLKEKEDDEAVNNPLKPENIEEQEKVNLVLKKPLLSKSEHVNLIRRGEKFEWNLTLESVQGTFENETLKMKKLEIQNVSTLEQISLDNYVLVDGVHDFPNFFKIKFNNENFKVDLIKMLHFNSKRTSLRDRLRKYNKKMNKAEVIKKSVSLPLI